MVIPPAKAFASVRLGSYQPLVQLATGGMATLYVARKVGAGGFERLVALKRVHPHLLENAEFREMFRDEARVCSVIRHPNVVSLIDVVDADGELFLVLDYVESLSLAELIKRSNEAGKRLPPAIVSRILCDSLAGLHAAHEAVDLRGARLDVIHRDVSPQNIVVGVDGTSRLIDFGIAKAVSRITVTNSGVVKGKLRYMSPEQVRQRPLDRRSDIFAAGLVLFEALTGRRLLGGEDEGDVALAILLGSFPEPSSIATDVPPAVDAVVAKALARDPNERYQSAAELEAALERAIPPAPARDVGPLVEALGAPLVTSRRDALRRALDSSPEIGSDDPADETDGVTTPAPTNDVGDRRRRTALLAAIVLVAVGILGVAGASIFTSSDRPHERRGAEESAALELSAPPPTASAASSATPRAEPPASETPAAETSTSPTAVPAAPGKAAPSRKRPRTLPSADLHRKNPYGPP